jgi:hypothetical protein
MKRNALLTAAVAVVVLFAFGSTGLFIDPGSPQGICTEDGRPVVRLYSATSCPRSGWIRETFDGVAGEYMDRGEIVAHHWELDVADDTLTGAAEGSVPAGEVRVYEQFSPEHFVPAFVFGCKYYRIGNGYESEDDLEAEEKEFREIIDSMLQGREPKLTTFLSVS